MASLERKLLTCGFRESCQFKLNFLVSLVEKLIRLLVLYYFYHAILAPGPLHDRTVLYIGLAVLVETLVQTDILDLLAQKIQTGESVYWSHRPGQLFFQLLCFATGKKLSAMLISILLISGLTIACGRSPGSLPAAFATLLPALLIFAQLQFFIGLLIFRLINSWGIRLLHRALFLVLSGVMIPPELLPEGLEPVFRVLPWRLTVADPVQCLQGAAVLDTLFLQIFWIFLLSFAIHTGWQWIRHDAAAVGG